MTPGIPPLQAVLAGDGPSLAQFAPGPELRDWLANTFSEPLLNADHIADFLIGSTQEGYAISPDCYACLRPYAPVKAGVGRADDQPLCVCASRVI